ncbi:MAG: transcription-repair coupling factor [Desulfobulbaceae bacterium]|nr:MAG: transcription-repair coupling factor [Desulfobulbaceae bacterium]
MESAELISVSGLRGGSNGWYAAASAKAGPVCCIVAQEQMVQEFEQDLQLFTNLPVLVYPGYEIPPYTPLSPDQRTTAARLSALYRLTESDRPFIMVISVEALLRRVLPKKELLNQAEYLVAGSTFDLDELKTSLVNLGYEHTALVRNIGDFSVRGGIVDIFPPPFLVDNDALHEGPLRLDSFGDTIETIRSFDPLSQRSGETIDEAILLPVSDIIIPSAHPQLLSHLKARFLDAAEHYDWLAEKAKELAERIFRGLRFAGNEFFLPLYSNDSEFPTATLFDYLPQGTKIISCDPHGISQQAELVIERIEANFQTAQQERLPALPPSQLFLSAAELTKAIRQQPQIQLLDFGTDQKEAQIINSSNHQLLKQEISLKRKTEGLLAPLVHQITNWFDDGGAVVLCCRSERRKKTLADLLKRFQLPIETINPPLNAEAIDRTLQPDTLYLCPAPLSKGFTLSDRRIHLLSEHELFADMRIGTRKKSKKPAAPTVNIAEISEGDVVVHREHGLAYYRGLVTMELQGVRNDFLQLEYKDKDLLYLPVDRLNLVGKYEGLSDRAPKIDKLGTQSWQATKKKVSEEVWKVAQQLLDVYAQRAVRKGRAFSAPSELYHDLEESFPFDETPGQYAAINDTIDDLISDSPMDRLICGDVGYGKTEVAIRAAFKVIEDGGQVAMLVPTTVLAEQHAKTFYDRLQGFPVKIDCLNRFRTRAEQKRMITDLAEGTTDILIGTHRLLSKDVVFKDLGLLIVDEEHRFGVAHKEKIKQLKAEVDILTLTATPIPRTLQMSLLGIRDLSVISSPPEHRRAVKTFVARYDNLVIKEAVSRELLRKGQVFVVHNRVKSIHRMARTIQDLVPDARIAVAHGQMDGKQLEEIMVKFVNHEVDVLVSTTIIESGLDIPSANTIIIDRADRLGLAEIYQLRGRVGRSSTQSFAYLLVPSLDHLSKESRDRLRALMEFSELGGGFKLAMSDLQIRGGGNLLGISQSGHIAAIGYDLYLDLLQKTVAELKARKSESFVDRLDDELDPEINLGISAYIPQDYIADISQRYLMYRRIASLIKEDELAYEDLKDELAERFGPLPKELNNLFEIVAIKKLLIPLKVTKLEHGPQNLVLNFAPNTPVNPELLASFVQAHSKKFRLTPNGRLINHYQINQTGEIKAQIRKIINQLQEFTDES